MVGSILAILKALSGLVFGIWKKRWSPEAELATLKERNKAQAEANQKAAKRLEDDYARFTKIKRTDDEIQDRLNKPL